MAKKFSNFIDTINSIKLKNILPNIDENDKQDKLNDIDSLLLFIKILEEYHNWLNS